MNIRFIGYGRLAKSLITKWQEQHHITVSTPNLKKDEKTLHQIICTNDNKALLEEQNLIVLAVKPKLIHQVLKEIADYIPKNSIIISLAAGITLESMEKHFPNLRFIRAMPNIAAELGESATLLMKNPKLADSEHQQIASLFIELGTIDWVNDDNLLDLGTILAGSGPAYVFYLMHAFQESATKLGMPESISKKLTLQTFLGASLLAKHSSESLQTLQEQVTSPKGTTEAAIEIFNHYQLDSKLNDAIKAAWLRILELRK